MLLFQWAIDYKQYNIFSVSQCDGRPMTEWAVGMGSAPVV